MAQPPQRKEHHGSSTSEAALPMTMPCGFDLCTHTHTGSSSLHQCIAHFIQVQVNPHVPSETRWLSQTNVKGRTVVISHRHDQPCPTKDIISLIGHSSEMAHYFHEIAECEHDSGKWKQAMAQTGSWKNAQKNLRRLVALQTEKHIECSTELCKDALSAPYGWYDMESASRQFPNKAADAMEKPTVKVIKEDALKRAYDAAGHSDKVVGILRMTKNNQCPRYMEQQKSDKNQDGDMFRRTDVHRFMTDGWSDEIIRRNGLPHSFEHEHLPRHRRSGICIPSSQAGACHCSSRSAQTLPQQGLSVREPV